jgi:cation transport regulator ChaC
MTRKTFSAPPRRPGEVRRHFAYGLNMDDRLVRAICPRARLAGPGMLAGYRFRITRYGMATVVPDARARTYGVVWEIARRDERMIDRFEGVREHFYRKRLLPVHLHAEEGEAAVPCLVYVAAHFEAGRPREGYMERVLSAARRHGLPDPYLAELRRWHAGPRHKGTDWT